MSTTTAELIARAERGDDGALDEVFERHRQRLRRMVDLRLGPALRRRVDPSDVVQEVYLSASRDLGAFRRSGAPSFALWLRLLARDRLVDQRRRHLGARARSADAERGDVDVERLTAGSRLTSPSAAAHREERRERVAAALRALKPDDREVLVMRHFEQLGNAEVAAELGIEPSAASKRYLRALRRLAAELGSGD